MPTIDGVKQVEQLAQQALAAPINNLIVVLAIAAIFIVLFFLFVGYKALPVITRIFTSLTDSYKAMADNIQKLTALEAQSETTSAIIIDELRKQTTAIQTTSAKTIDTLTENTEEIRKLAQMFVDLRSKVEDALQNLDDKADKTDINRKFDEFQVSVVKAFAEHMKRKTDSQPITPVITSELKTTPISELPKASGQ